MKGALLNLSLLVSTVVGGHPRDAFTRVKSRNPGPGLVTNLEARTSAPQHAHRRAFYSSQYLNNGTERS